MQAIDGACVDKAGHRARAAFDKDFLHAGRMERLHDPVWINEACAIRYSDYFYHSPALLRATMKYDAPAAVVSKAARGQWHSLVRVNHHAGGIAAFDAANCQFRVVMHDRSYAHHDRVDICPQPVKMIKCATAIDPTAGARKRGNSSVERLSELRNNERPVRRRLEQGGNQRIGIGLAKIVVVYRH